MLDLYEMRTPCKECGCKDGYISDRNGQACVFCSGCDKWQYNAPKKERGLIPESVRTNGISPSKRYKVMERAGFRCEFCGSQGVGMSMHVGHIVSVKDLRTAGLPDHLHDDIDNLVWLCAECNLGQGDRSLTLHEVLVFTMRRKIGGA